MDRKYSYPHRSRTCTHPKDVRSQRYRVIWCPHSDCLRLSYAPFPILLQQFYQALTLYYSAILIIRRAFPNPEAAVRCQNCGIIYQVIAFIVGLYCELAPSYQHTLRAHDHDASNWSIHRNRVTLHPEEAISKVPGAHQDKVVAPQQVSE